MAEVVDVDAPAVSVQGLAPTPQPAQRRRHAPVQARRDRAVFE
jgi:hypothetical protein